MACLCSAADAAHIVHPGPIRGQSQLTGVKLRYVDMDLKAR